LKQLNHQADEVVISGSMKEVVRNKSTVPVEIYKASFFKKTAVSNLFESMQMVNGVLPVTTCNVCNTGSISINGLDGPYTMVMIDGMPIVSALSSVYGLNGIPNSMIDRIEVVKGPASTLYGSEALAGLINIITTNPSAAPQLSVDVFGTTYNELNVDLAAKYASQKFVTLFSANFFNQQTPWDKNKDGFTDIALQQRVSLFNKWQFYNKAKRNNSIALRYIYEDRWGGQTQWNKSFRGSDSVYGESIYTHRAELIGNYDVNAQRNLKLMYSYNLHYQNSMYGITPYNALQQVGFVQLYNNMQWRKHDITAGIATRYNYYDDNTVATQKGDSGAVTNKPLQTILPGVFVQNEIAFSLRHQLLLGGRVDFYRSHGFIFSPRMNYRWRLNESNTIRLSAGNGFRVVNLFTEDHAALTGARRVVVRSELQPEQSYNINANYTRFLSFDKGFITLELSPFYTYFTNRIIADYDTDPDAIIYDNLNGFAVSRGVSFTADATWKKGTRLNIGATALDVFREDKLANGQTERLRLLYAPEWMIIAQFTLPISAIDISVDYTAQAYGPMRMPVLENDFRPAYSPAYSLHHIQLTKTFHNGLALYGGVRNLFNFMPLSPIMRPNDPFDKQVNDVVNNPNQYTFDAAYNYAPVMGIRFFAGVRYVIK
jgi:outer membrane receptor for ferrienterochelin and colicins